MKTKIKAGFLFTSILILASCTNDTTVILRGHNFNSCDWLLVNVDHVKHTFKLIDDEAVLANHLTGIEVN